MARRGLGDQRAVTGLLSVGIDADARGARPGPGLSPVCAAGGGA